MTTAYRLADRLAQFLKKFFETLCIFLSTLRQGHIVSDKYTGSTMEHNVNCATMHHVAKDKLDIYSFVMLLTSFHDPWLPQAWDNTVQLSTVRVIHLT